VQGFKVKELFSEAFKRHDGEEIDRRLSAGLPETTPPVTHIESGWPKPWMFVRMLLGAIVLYLGFRIIVSQFQGSANLLGALIITGSFAVPLATLTFFFELNTPRNISSYRIMRSMLLGALISLAAAMLLFSGFADMTNSIGPPIAGVFEEVAKLVTVVLVTMRLDPKRYPWILNGLLFGAAVGTGFAAFESAGYATRFLVGTGNADAVNQVILLRGMLSPLGHIVWTALCAGALWRAKGDQPFSFKLLSDKRVLRVVPLVMLLHATWDFDKVPEGPFYLKYLVLGAIAWALVISMVQSGLKQIVVAQRTLASQGQAQVTGSTTLLGEVGPIGGAAPAT
jgi:protease PrsW